MSTSAARPEAPEPLLFGMERELEYTGHITQVMHFVPLPRRVFASADETHIRVWGQEGDIVKKTFPSNQRSMVTAMAFCPTFSALITTEVDMTLKLYTMEKLELIDTFSLQQAKKNAKGGDKVKTSQKVSTLVYFPQHKWVIVGGDSGSDLYRIEKSTTRRTRAVDVLEYHLKMDHLRQVTTEPVSRVVPHPAESRVLVWGPASLHVFDMDLSLIVSCRKPHAAPVCSACVHVVSSMETALLTGGADGHVNFWVVQSRSALSDRGGVDESTLESAAAEEGSSMRLQHSFHGHSRAVEIVNFYHRLQRDMRQRLCVSYARDSKMKVWSLEHFSLVYTLDQSFLDSRSSIFSLLPHFFAVSSTYMKQDGLGKSATVTLVRFTAHVATPFATTNHSPVVSIAQPPVEVEVKPASAFSPQVANPTSSSVSTAAAIISEDMAVRLVDTANAGLIATLPPPPNSKVQVLRAFICPVWQLLVLWLSSEEIAIFFIPTGTVKGPAFKRVSNNTTPLLLRRFGIVEVRAEVLDKDLSNEAFHSVALHHGWPLPAQDTLVSWTLDGKATPAVDESAPPEPDWYLVVGTKVGTLQVFLLSEVLEDLPVWQRLAPQLPGSLWRGRTGGLWSRKTSMSTASGTSGLADPRLQGIELEHLEAMEEMRAPGQQPFPRGAPPLLLYGRWRCHDYAVEVTESIGNRLLTVDAKRNLKIWRAGDMSCLFHIVLNAFVCHAPYIRPEAYSVPALAASSTWRLLSKRGSRRKSDKSTAAENSLQSMPEAEAEAEKTAEEDAEEAEEANTAGEGAAAAGSEAEANTSDAPAEDPGKAEADSAGDDPAEARPRARNGEDGGKVLALAGLAVGTAGGGIQLLVVGGGDATPKEPQSFASHTSHGAAMVQIDYSWSANVFVSIGRDDVVKLWSGSLALLRDISFPAPLTSISFRREPGVDRAGGNGDILVGFAAHVEQIPFETWSRGIPEEELVSHPGRGNGAEEPLRTSRGLLRLDASDDINEHSIYLHSNKTIVTPRQDALQARDLLRMRQGVNFGGAAMVAKFARKMMEAISDEKKLAKVQEKPKPFVREGGEVMDFRGPPLMEVGVLSGKVADWDMLSAAQAARESKDPVVDHQRSGTLDRGDFRALTRCYPQYYDWSVSPNTTVDAPREQAMRGVVNGDNIAHVTSLGIGHLRSVGTDDEITGELDSLDAVLSLAGEESIDSSPKPLRPGSIGPRRPFRLPKQGVLSPRERQAEARGKQQSLPPRPKPPAAAIPTHGPSPPGAPAAPSKPPAAPARPPPRAGAPQAAKEKPTEKPAELQDAKRLSVLQFASLNSAAVGGEQPVARGSRVQPPLAAKAAPTSPGAGASEAAPARASPKAASQPRGSVAQPRASVAAGAAQHRASVSLDGARANEPWRSHFIGRGVPKSENDPKPRSQALANTDGDSARLLEERGNLQDAPEVPEDNFLKSLFAKKTDWLYYPSDSHVLNARRNEIKVHVEERRTSNATWTTSGRYICAAQSPPVRAMPESVTASRHPGPLHYQHRTCMTRAEVTEQRLIEAAMCGPPPPVPDLSIYSNEQWRRSQQPPFSSRSSSFGSGSRSSAARREELTLYPLTAR